MPCEHDTKQLNIPIESPPLESLSPDARGVTVAILEVARQLRLNREQLAESPGWEMAEISLRQLKAAMGGGVIGVPGVFKPGSH
jgi:hypothetical protein